MGLGFLDDILGGAADAFSPSKEGGAGLGDLLNVFGVGRPKAKYGPTPSEAQANSLFQALLDPNNSLVKQNADINMQKGMRDFLMTLRKMQMQGARAQARGVNNPFFNPERMDENMDFMLTRGQTAIADKARNQARNDIYTTAEALKGFAPAEQARVNAQMANRDRDYSQFQTAGGFNQIGGGLRNLMKILSPAQSGDEYGPYQLPWLNK